MLNLREYRNNSSRLADFLPWVPLFLASDTTSSANGHVLTVDKAGRPFGCSDRRAGYRLGIHCAGHLARFSALPVPTYRIRSVSKPPQSRDRQSL